MEEKPQSKGAEFALLSEDQLKQVETQANSWAQFLENNQLMVDIGRQMKEIPELPSEKAQDLNPLVRVTFPDEGGVLTYMENMQYPYRGYPLGEFVEKIDLIKKVSRAFLSGLYHRLKKRNKLWFLTLLPSVWIGKDLVRAWIYVVYRLIDRFKLKKERYCLFIRELYRAFSVDQEGESEDDKEWRCMIRDVICMILEMDNAYRYRAQDILVELDKKRILSDTAGELIRLIGILSTRERQQEVKDTGTLYSYFIRFYLRFDGRIRKIFGYALSQLDLEKVKLTIEDKEYCVMRKDYTFGFMVHPIKEEETLLKLGKASEAWREEKIKIREKNTIEYEGILSRHKEEKKLIDSLFSKNDEEKGEVTKKLEQVQKFFSEEIEKLRGNYQEEKQKLADQLFTEKQKNVYQKHMQELKEFDAKHNAMLTEAEEKYVREKKNILGI